MDVILRQIQYLTTYDNDKDLYSIINELITNKQLFNFIRPKNYEIITKKLTEELDDDISKEYNFDFNEWIKQIYEDDVNIVQKQIEYVLSNITHMTSSTVCWHMFYDPRYFQYLLNNMKLTYPFIVKNKIINIFLKIIDFYHLVEIYTNKYTFIEWKYHSSVAKFWPKKSKDYHNIHGIVHSLDWNKVVLVGSACQRLYFNEGAYNDIDLINKTDNLENCAMSCFISIKRALDRRYEIIYKSEYKIIAKFEKTADAPDLNVEVFNVDNLEEKVSNFHFDPARMYYDGKFHMTIGCFKSLHSGIIHGAKYFTGKKSIYTIFENYSKKGYRFVLPVNDQIRSAFYKMGVVIFDPQGCDFDKVNLKKINRLISNN